MCSTTVCPKDNACRQNRIEPHHRVAAATTHLLPNRQSNNTDVRESVFSGKMPSQRCCPVVEGSNGPLHAENTIRLAIAFRQTLLALAEERRVSRESDTGPTQWIITDLLNANNDRTFRPRWARHAATHPATRLSTDENGAFFETAASETSVTRRNTQRCRPLSNPREYVSCNSSGEAERPIDAGKLSGSVHSILMITCDAFAP